jgi:type VI protein secretion system component VasF
MSINILLYLSIRKNMEILMNRKQREKIAGELVKLAKDLTSDRQRVSRGLGSNDFASLSQAFLGAMSKFEKAALKDELLGIDKSEVAKIRRKMYKAIDEYRGAYEKLIRRDWGERVDRQFRR